MVLTGIVVVTPDFMSKVKARTQFMKSTVTRILHSSIDVNSARTELTMRPTALYLFHLTCLEGDRLDKFLARIFADWSCAVQTACSIVFRC